MLWACMYCVLFCVVVLSPPPVFILLLHRCAHLVPVIKSPHLFQISNQPFCHVQSLLCLPVTVCVAGGVVAPELQLSRHTCSQFQGNHALLKSLVGAPRGRRIIPSSFLMCGLIPCSCVLLPDVLPVGVTSTCPALPAASSRHLPSLLFVPFRPAPPGPAQPAVPPGTDLTWSSCRPAGICPPGQPPFRRYLTLLLILPLPAGICLPCSPCRSAGICPPAPRSVPPAPDLRIPPLRRYLPGLRSLPFQPVPDSPASSAGSSWSFPLLHILHILH